MKSGIAILVVVFMTLAGSVDAGAEEGLTLESALRQAWDEGRDVELALARVAEQEAALGVARSERWPSFAFSQRMTRVDSSTVERANSAATGLSLLIGFEIPPFVFEDSYRTQLEASLPLWTSGARRASIDGAAAGLEARRAGLDASQRTVARQVVARFYGLARAEAVGEARRQALVRAERRLAEAERRQDLGLGTRQEVLRWKVEVEGARAALASSEADGLVARLDLADVLGSGLDQLGILVLPGTSIIEALLEWAESIDPMVVLSAAEEDLDESPEVRSATAERSAADSAVAGARALRRPRLDAAAAYGWLENETLELDEFENWSASLVLTVPLDLRGRERQEVARREARRRAADVAVEEARAGRRLELGRALAELGRARARLRSARRATDEAGARRELLVRRSEIGLASLLDLVDADTTLVDAEVGLATARVDLLAAVAAVELAWPDADPPGGGLIP